MRKTYRLLTVLGIAALAVPIQAGAQQSTAKAKAAPAPAPKRAATVGQAMDRAEQERLNRQMVEFSARQNAENAARSAAYEDAVREREATIARQEAERVREIREYEEAMSRWRADVEACRTGDSTRCGK